MWEPFPYLEWADTYFFFMDCWLLCRCIIKLLHLNLALALTLEGRGCFHRLTRKGKRSQTDPRDCGNGGWAEGVGHVLHSEGLGGVVRSLRGVSPPPAPLAVARV